ncbi:RDD family protein [Streptomyces sp. NPDC005955]|uniref:RDD family protein n=1 Tax=Streptomyces sp. NPDC005955 TaxID=3364738 RepID=UPI0036AFF5D6
MSSEPPRPGPGQPEDDPFSKQPPSEGGVPPGGSPYDPPPGGPPPGGPPPGGQSPGQPPGGWPEDGGPPGGPPPPSGGGPTWGAPPPGGEPPPPPPGSGSPYGAPPPPPGGGPYGAGGGSHGGADPLAGMPPLADSGKRVLARIIDMIIVGVVVWLLSWAFGVSGYSVDPDEVEYGKSFGQSVLAAILYIGYDTVLISRTGQTVGKRLFKMRVANLDNGATPSVQTSLVRAAVLWLPFAFCCACVWTAIAGGWSFFDKPFKQGLHDKAAKTVEVSTV